MPDRSHDVPAGTPGPFVPVVPAGGAGTRLWPLSRRDRPKFLLDLTGSGRSLLQQTLDRVAPLADRAPIVVTGTAHAAEVREQAGPLARVVAEPSPRNSMPAIALAAAIAEREDADAVIGSFAADHVVHDEAALRAAVAAARRAAERGYLATIGIAPTGPSTAFGYIEQSDAPDGHEGPGGLEGTGALPVARFVEKPDRERAEEFLATGRFWWNAGMFVVRADVLLDALAEQIPAIAHGARRIAQARGTAAESEVLEETWPMLTSIAIDHALAEPLAAAGRVAVVPARFGWDDVGDFGALARLLRAGRTAPGSTAAAPEGDGGERGAAASPALARPQSGQDVLVLGDAETAAVDARATVYGASDRLVALVGLRDVSVAITKDAILVIADDRAQELGLLGPELERLGRADLR